MPYTDSKEQAQDNRSSAWALMIIGGVCLVGFILCITGVLPFRIASSYVIYCIGILGLLFIVMSIVSLNNAKKYAKKAESEKFLRDTVLDWCRENLAADSIDAEVGGYQVVAEEELYFRRAERIRNKINHQFMNLDQNFLENLIDETIYDMVYEK